MKKIYLLIAFATITMAANAQEIFSVEGRIPQIIPGELTADGKARMFVRLKRDEGNDLFYIYNENMELETTLEAPVTSYPVKGIVETATVPGTSKWNYDASAAVWSLEQEVTGTDIGKVYDIDNFYNMDTNSSMKDCDIPLTQTLFNNDEDWEFTTSSYYGNYSNTVAESYDETTGTVFLRRTSVIQEGGVRIFNQDGQLVRTIGDTGEYAIDAIWIAKGKKYVTTRSSDKAVNGGYTNKVFLVNDSGSNSGKSQVRGDVNEDGTVNGTDIQEVINIIVDGE